MNEDCEIIRDLLPLYADDICSTSTKELVEKHLNNCNECQKILEIMKKGENIKNNKNFDEKESIKSFNKKIKKNTVKTVIISLVLIILGIILIKYIYNCILFNHIINKAHKFNDIDNMYIQEMESCSGDEVFVTRKYYKDGKLKEVQECYTKDTVTTIYTMYASLGSDEVVIIDYINNKARIEKELEILTRSESMLKRIPFVYNNSIGFRTITPIFLSIKSKEFDVGSYSNEDKQCYVLQDRFDIGTNWEIWLDKETGLPLKEINFNASKTYYSDNKEVNIEENNIEDYLNQKKDILIKSSDSVTEYKYEFDIVTDEDVKMPDLSQYEIERTEN